MLIRGHLIVAAVALDAALASAPPPAVADTTASSTIAQIKVVERSDASHKLYRGAIWLDYDKATYNYR